MLEFAVSVISSPIGAFVEFFVIPTIIVVALCFPSTR